MWKASLEGSIGCYRSFQESTPRETITRVAMLTELSSDGVASFQVKLYAMRANHSQSHITIMCDYHKDNRDISGEYAA